MNDLDRVNEAGLLQSARAGDPAATARLRRLIADNAWTVCLRLCHDAGRARLETQEFMRAAQAGQFALLAGFDGRGRLGSFIILVTREFLAKRLLQAIHESKPHAWPDFAALFDQDIRRVIRRRLPGAAHEAARDDAYQDICLGLVAENWSRVKSWAGKGSFGGFILQTADRLLMDALRRQNGRPRPPRALDRLSPLAKEIYRLHRHEAFPLDPGLLLARLTGQQDNPPDLAAILAAVGQVDGVTAMLSNHSGGRREEPLLEAAGDTLADTSGTSPEQSLLRAERENILDDAATALRQAMTGLTDPERAYLSIILNGPEAPPARDIARLMGEPVAEIYKLKQRLLPRLKAMLVDSPAIKTWAASVLSD